MSIHVALALAGKGYAVFPASVQLTKPKTIKPRVAWRMASTTLPGMIREWWRQHPEDWVCIDTGKSGIVVVDCDVDDSGLENFLKVLGGGPTGYILPTSSGGRHHLYRADPGREHRDSESLLTPSVDVRGVGGMILVHPCAHGSIPSLPGPSELDAVPDCVPTGGSVAATLPTEATEDLFDAPTELREFTPDEAKAFIKKYARDPLVSAPRGRINYTLNKSAVVMSHFVPEFYSVEDARGWLLEWQRRAWIASGGRDDGNYTAALKTIDSGLRQTNDPWRATHRVASQPQGEEPGLNLPDSFWESREVLRHIRAVAHQRTVSADIALHALLARISSMVSHDFRVVSSMGEASLNLFTVPVGPSGAGKTQAVKLAAQMLPTPDYLPPSLYPDGVPAGSGEGLAELFIGNVEVQVPNGSGGTRAQKTRGVVLHNALIYIDEGATLVEIGKRSGSTTLSALRTAWVGETLGQMNGRPETTRLVPSGSYAMGLIMGFQLSTIEPILDDSGSGTLQRLLLAWALDPSIPREAQAEIEPLIPNIEHVISWGHDGQLTRMPIPQEADDELREMRYLVNTGSPSALAESDRHMPLHLMKLASLLALLDCRKEISQDDWGLAHTMWGTSCRVRDHCIQKTAEARHAAAVAAQEEQVRIRVRASVESAETLQERSQGAVERIAGNLLRKVRADGPLGRSALRRTVGSGDRAHFDEALEHALDAGWLRAEEGPRGGAVIHLDRPPRRRPS